MSCNYRIVVDSCCDMEEQYRSDERIGFVPLSIQVGDTTIIDDETFDQADLIKRIAECPEGPKSACPSPEAYMEEYNKAEDHVFVVTLSSKLSGSYNSAVLGANLFEETYGRELKIHVVDSESASVGEVQIAMELLRLEEEGHSFEEIVELIEKFRDSVKTYFVLNTLETFIKSGRIRGIKAMVATTLNIKPVLIGVKGEVEQLDQAIGMRKALSKMTEHVINDLKGCADRCLMISHCNAPERAIKIRDMILEKAKFIKVVIVDMRGISTMYANEGGIIITV